MQTPRAFRLESRRSFSRGDSREQSPLLFILVGFYLAGIVSGIVLPNPLRLMGVPPGTYTFSCNGYTVEGEALSGLVPAAHSRKLALDLASCSQRYASKLLKRP
jgi:hypothetical protein